MTSVWNFSDRISKVVSALAEDSRNEAKAEANLLLLPVKFQTEVIATITGNGVCFQIQ